MVAALRDEPTVSVTSPIVTMSPGCSFVRRDMRVPATMVNANGAWFDDVKSVGTSTAVRAVLAAVSPLPLLG